MENPLFQPPTSQPRCDFWSEIIALVENGTVDTWCTFLQHTEKRGERFSLSAPLFHVRSGFAVRRCRSDSELLVGGMWSLFRPFSLTTWVVICAALATQMLIGLAISWLERKVVGGGSHRRNTGESVAWQMLRMQLRQATGGAPPLFRTLAGRLAMTVFGLMQCLLLLSMYQAGIVYSLARPPPVPPFTSLDELLLRLDTGEERLVRRWGQARLMLQSWFFEEVNSSYSWPYPILRRTLAQHPPLEARSNAEMLATLHSGRHVAVTQEDSRLHLVVATTECDMTVVYEGMPTKGAHIFLRKGHPMLERLNAAIKAEAPEIRRIVARYERYVHARRERTCADPEMSRRRWSKLGG